MIDANPGDRPVIAIERALHLLATLTARCRLTSLNSRAAQQPLRVDGPAARGVR